MVYERWLKHAISALTAAALCTTSLLYETRHAESHKIRDLLLWSRQVAQQAEALSMFAKENKEEDPVSWAARYLTVGSEARLMQVRAFNDPDRGGEREKYTFETVRGEFTYSRIIDDITGQGIQIHIQSGYLGFLGSHTRWVNDSMVIALFLLFYSLIIQVHTTLSFMSPAISLKEEDELIEQIRNPPRLKPIQDNPEERVENKAEEVEIAAVSESAPDQQKEAILNWIQEAKGILVDLGSHIKAMTLEAKNLTEAAAQSQAAIEGNVELSSYVRDKIETLEILILEQNPPSKSLQDALASLKEMNGQAHELLNSAFLEYGQVYEMSEKLSSSITKTTDSLIHEVKMMQTLKSKVSN